MSGVFANPLPTDGVVDKLNPEQLSKLKELWQGLLTIVAEAPVDGSNGTQVDNADVQNIRTPRIPDGQPLLSYANELQTARACVEKHGSARFMACFWRFISHDYPDATVLKFMRARKWQVSAALTMLVECVQWRLESDVEKILALGEEGMQDVEGFIHQLESGKAYVHGTDREGRPVCYVHVRLHKIFGQPPKTLEDFVVYFMECMRCLAAPPNEKADVVFDMTGFGLSNMDWRCTGFILKCLEAYYPEALNCILINNAPWIFQGIWTVLAPMMDPAVRAKVQFTRGVEDLKVHIDEKHLLKPLGGRSDWQWAYLPVVPGENAKILDTARKAELHAERDALISEFEDATWQWIASSDDAIAARRRLLDNKLRIQSFALDPYVRGRTVYHRMGNIAGDGCVAFDYPGLAPEDAREVLGEAKAVEALKREVEAVVKD